jgi:diguanylate cyclase (GGDEF)-like protein
VFLLGEVFSEHLDRQSIPALMKGLRLLVEIVTSLHLGSIEDTAGTDRLTGLPNGRALDTDLDVLLDSGAEETVIVVIDLDGLKVANDEFGGHPEGDRYIRRFAANLHEVVRQQGGRAYRWHEGGDEFCVIFQQVDRNQVKSFIEDHRARSDVAPFCFGVAAAPDDAVEREALTNVADERLNAMKQERSQEGRAAEARDWLANEGWAPSG